MAARNAAILLTMLQQSISSWLTTPDDYPAGLQLLRETGYTGFTLTILAMGDDAYNRSRLEKELRTWLDKQNIVSNSALVPGSTPKESIASVVTEFPTKSVPVLTQIPKNQASGTGPVAVLELQAQTYRLLDERTELKAGLRAKMDEGNSEALMAERLPKAIRIKQITRHLDEIYSRLDFYEQHGYLPTTEPIADGDDTVALYNVRSYVSLYKGKLRSTKLTPEQRQRFEQLLEEYSKRKQQLETKLKPQNDPDTTRQQTQDCERNPAPFPRA